MPFPLPPVPGTSDIVPLVNSDALSEEGEQQKNCVRTYAKWVAKGEGHIYRVLRPERATLAIAKGPDGNWQIAQLKLACNQPVAEQTRKTVEAWLKRYSISV